MDNTVELKKIIILGSSGFIGSHLEKYFKESFPDISVVGYSSNDCDLTELKQVMNLRHHIDQHTLIIMCSMLKKEQGDNLQTYMTNMQMIYNLSQLLSVVYMGKFIYFSSAGVYGEDIENLSIDEQTPVNPRTYYSMAKYSAECLFRKTLESAEKKLLILRPPVIYGPGDRSLSYGPSGFIDKAVKNETITLWGDGSEKRELIYIDDVVALISACINNNASGVFNLVSGRSYSFKDVLDNIEKQMAKQLVISQRPRSKDKVDHGFNNNKLNSLLPSFEFTDLHQGISDMLSNNACKQSEH